MHADANIGTYRELIASRARIVAAADEARRHLERDLHDGIQQRLVSLGFALRTAQESVPQELDGLRQELGHIISGLAAASGELRDMARGIHPAIVSIGGLGTALKALARRSAVPVNLDLTIDRRLGDAVELTTYYVVAEALTNTTKHANASELNVSARADERTLVVSISDNGVGGADPRKGTGLLGLEDRIHALGGQLVVVSPRGAGTALHIAIPLNTPAQDQQGSTVVASESPPRCAGPDGVATRLVDVRLSAAEQFAHRVPRRTQSEFGKHRTSSHEFVVADDWTIAAARSR
jgi:signal transduction histidine kinase